MQVTVKTLRHYESLGLLIPAEVDDSSGYRYYTISQMQRLNSILALKNLGFSLEEIGCRVAGHPRTVYVDGIWNEENPENWLSIIQIPIENRNNHPQVEWKRSREGPFLLFEFE